MAGRLVYRAHDYESWLRLRSAGHGSPNYSIGASDVPSVMGMSTMRGQWDVWTDHMGPKHSDPLTDDDVRTRGHLFEPFLAAHYAEATGRKIDTSLLIVADPSNPWRKASTDALVGGDMQWQSAFDSVGGIQTGRWSPSAEARVVECKTFSFHARDKWARRDVVEPVSAHDAVAQGLVPEHYVTQCIWQALVCDVEFVDVVAVQCSTSRHPAVTAGGDLLEPVWVMEGRPFVVSLAIAPHVKSWLADKVDAWRNVHLVDGLQPDPDGSAAQMRAYKQRMSPGSVEASDDIRKAAADLARARARAKECKAEEKAAKGRIVSLLGDSTQAVEPEDHRKYVARTRVSSRGTLTIDAVDTL